MQCAIKENVVIFEVPVDDLVRVDIGKCRGNLLAPSKSLFKTDVAFMFLNIWKYAQMTSKLKSNPSLDRFEILKKAFVSPILCEALIDFSFLLDSSSITFRKRGFYDSIGCGI